MSTNTTSSFERLTRRTALIIGLVLFIVGIAAIVIVQPLVGVLPSSIALVVLAGAIAFILGVWMIRTLYRGGAKQNDIPDIELPLSTPQPGYDIDRALYQLTEYQKGTTEYRNQIQEQLASVAVAVIRHRDDCSREQAIHKLEEGTWTDNQYAASFFTGGSPPGKSFVDRLSDRFTGDDSSPYERWVRITIDTIVEHAGMTSTTEPHSDADRGPGFFARLRGESTTENDAVLTQSDYDDIVSQDNVERSEDGISYYPLLQTGHWRGITAFALITAGWGIITFQPEVFLVSVVGVGFAAYARGAMEPDVSNLEVERHVSETDPLPGETVSITITIHNTGDSFMSDLRFADRVPASIRVVDGSPRLATALRPNSSASFTYTVIAERGKFQWPLFLLARDISGSIERKVVIEVDQGIRCMPSLKPTADSPVRSKTSLFSGQVDTSIGGSGLEFFSVREYREGDPMKRIDWNRQARTGEFATIDFRKELAAKVVLLFDSRDSAYVSPGPNERHAVDLSADAGMELFASLFDRGDLVGIAAFDTVPLWLGPSAGDEHAERARRIFATHPAISSTPPRLKDVEGQYIDPMTHVRRQFSPEDQIMLFSPLCDNYPAEVARRLDSAGHLVTIISPNPTADRTPGQRLARLERTMRVMDLRERGIRVIDWSPEELLRLEIERAQQRWAV